MILAILYYQENFFFVEKNKFNIDFIVLSYIYFKLKSKNFISNLL